jgi:hypothetical protein
MDMAALRSNSLTSSNPREDDFDDDDEEEGDATAVTMDAACTRRTYACMASAAEIFGLISLTVAEG